MNLKRKNKEYKDGELEIIFSLVPTDDNITHLAKVLDRSERAIQIVYKIAYENKKLGKGIQREKIFETKKKLGIKIGGVKP